MRAADLGSRRVAVWGLAREGRAAIKLLRKHHPNLPLLLLDDAADASAPDTAGGNITCAFGADRIAGALDGVDVIVKSPGVSLYRPEIRSARENGIAVTSLLNLWFGEQLAITTICITGTKGKSTTASLIAHILAALGRKVALVGNIGIPITDIDNADFAVIEVSSYQAADFDGLCDVAVLTSLYPEHVDWHQSIPCYFRDKINLLERGRRRIVNRDAIEAVEPIVGRSSPTTWLFNDASGLHACGTRIFDGPDRIGEVRNPYLARSHNRSNLCAALAVAKTLDIDIAAALDASAGFRGLPHRQQELGEIGGVLFVDDSISTIPESTIAALEVYAGRDITVIVGGYDRGLDYSRLVEKLSSGAAKAIICLGNSGQRIYAQARAVLSRQRDRACSIERAASMEEAVASATRVTPPGGVVLLSPAAPSYGNYRDFVERGLDFAAKLGLPTR
jgi:UDP-N-acetylmuramoylalanine--D-glutamate ligase